MKVMTVVGARPQFIKAGPVSRVLRARHQEVLVHTGQHYDETMSERFFDELGLPPPDVNLAIGSGPHGQQTGRMLERLEEVIVDVRPDLVMVYGDTNSTLAGALAAAKLHVPVAHVEAGLRSRDRRMPEELNRVVTDHLSDLCLCPDAAAAANLAAEGVTATVEVVGDVMLDALLQNRERAAGRPLPVPFAEGAFVLATIHRAENTDDGGRLGGILAGLAGAGLPVVLPLHPRTRAAIDRAGVPVPAHVHILEPAGYVDMIALESRAAVVATDSGGVQKEAYILGTPCVTMRDSTEWRGTVDTGWNVLVGADPAAITAAVRDFRPAGPRPSLFGDGRSAERIVAALEVQAGADSARPTPVRP